MTSSASIDWATPDQLFYFLDREFEFTLDVCAGPDNAKTPSFFDADVNGLEQENWNAHSNGFPVWMNPPYGRGISAWIQKAFEESKLGATVVCLLPARTDTSWWHDYCMKGEIRFLRGRLRFNNDRRGRAPFPSAVVIFRGSRVAPHA